MDLLEEATKKNVNHLVDLLGDISTWTEDERTYARKWVTMSPRAGVIRLTKCLLNKRRFKFNDPKTGKTIMGVTLTFSDPALVQDPDQEGLLVEKYSLVGENQYNGFNAMPTAPQTVLVEMQIINKRAQVTGIWDVKVITKAVFDRLRAEANETPTKTGKRGKAAEAAEGGA